MNPSLPSTFFLSPATRNRSRARGFSLLEVAIALVIFVFGALAIVRIFPGALRVINIGGARQNALNINRATMARVQSNVDTIPQATYDVGTSTDLSVANGGWVDGYQNGNASEPRAVLGSTRRGYSLPRTSNQSDVDQSALGSIRAVAGEGTIIRSVTVSPATGSPITKNVLFTRFPLSGDSTTPASVVVKKRFALDGATIDSNGTIDISNARDAATGEPFVEPTGTLTYYVSFRYKDNGAVWGIVSAPAIGKVVSLPDVAPVETGTNAVNRVIAGNVDVVCVQTLATLNPADEGDMKRGIVDVSSLSMVAPGDHLLVDYLADWTWLLQDGLPDAVPEAIGTASPGPTPTPTAVPTVQPRQLALGAPFIEDHSLDSVYTLCETSAVGQPKLYPEVWGEGAFVTGKQKLFQPTSTDLRSGRLTIETQTPNEQLVDVRVAFRTRDNWSQQLSVAAAAYKPYVSGQIEPWRDYYLDANNGVIYFHASEAGKSVMVTYSYTDGTTPITLRNRLITISDDTDQTTSAPAGFARLAPASTAAFVSRLDLTDANGDLLSTPPTSISSVRGASVTVRTAWLDGSRYTQSFLTAMRAGTGAEAMP